MYLNGLVGDIHGGLCGDNDLRRDQNDKYDAEFGGGTRRPVTPVALETQGANATGTTPTARRHHARKRVATYRRGDQGTGYWAGDSERWVDEPVLDRARVQGNDSDDGDQAERICAHIGDFVVYYWAGDEHAGYALGEVV